MSVESVQYCSMAMLQPPLLLLQWRIPPRAREHAMPPPPSQTKLTPTSLTTSIKKRLPNTPRHKISPRSTSQSSFNRSSTLSCACCVVHSLAWRNAVRTQYSCARVCWRDAPCRLAIGGRKIPPSLVEHTSFFVDCGSLRGFGRLMMAWFARGEGGGSWKPWGARGLDWMDESVVAMAVVPAWSYQRWLT